MLGPIAATVAAIAFQGLIQQWKKTRFIAMAVAFVYLGSALYWNMAAARGRETGGVRMWSNGINAVKDHLVTNYQGREIMVLDWALQNSLYVLSNAQIKSTEIF